MMSDESLELCKVIAEASRCSICKGYLSFSPIWMLSNGNKICGRCTAPNPEEVTIRDTFLEDILTLISFPCCFEGCDERRLFDQVIEHEINCEHRKISCFVTRCMFHRGALMLFKDIIQFHKDVVKKKAEIELQVQESKDGTIIVVVKPFHFIIKYVYEANNFFKCGVACYPTDNISFEITLKNKADSDSAIHLPAENCQTLNENGDNLHNQMELALQQYSGTLNNPDSIVIVIDLLVAPLGSTRQLLKLPKCGMCGNYLIPPLFTSNTNIVYCYECGENDDDDSYKPSDDEELSQMLKQIDFPCRWKNCTFLGKYDVYKKHLTSCKFYVLHKCFLSNCEATFTVLNAIDHYTNNHSAEYFVGKLVLTISFSKVFDSIRKHTMIGDVYFFFEHKMTAKENEDSEYILTLKSTISGGKTVTVHLEHQHRPTEPKRKFQLNCLDSLTIKLNELPSCYEKEDELTVTINLE